MGDLILLYYIILVLILLKSISNLKKKILFDMAWIFSFNTIIRRLFKNCNFGNQIIYLKKGVKYFYLFSYFPNFII